MHRNSDDDRRRHPRVNYDIPVIVSEGGHIRTHTPRDLSAGGVFLLADEPPAIDTPVFVEFVLGRTFRLTTRGRVVRVESAPETVGASARRRGFAIAFDRLAEEEKAQLGDLVDAERDG